MHAYHHLRLSLSLPIACNFELRRERETKKYVLMHFPIQYMGIRTRHYQLLRFITNPLRTTKYLRALLSYAFLFDSIDRLPSRKKFCIIVYVCLMPCHNTELLSKTLFHAKLSHKSISFFLALCQGKVAFSNLAIYCRRAPVMCATEYKRDVHNS